ncbi:MAG: cytochrome c [Gemmatimonadaceae bacterium]|nr:cytochrome c [Gemmatimonadaceae bacterium]
MIRRALGPLAVCVWACDTPSHGGAADTASVVQAGVPLVYARCVGCHQLNGQGIPNVYPPLTGDSRVNGPIDRAIAITLHGIEGALAVNGRPFLSAMLPSGDGLPMTNEEIASVLTYARSSWGNTATAVSAADVSRVRAATAGRARPWTAAELQSLP